MGHDHCLEVDNSLRCLIHLKILIPVQLAPGVECAAAFGTARPTLHILFHSKHVLAVSTQYCSLVSLRQRPYVRYVGFACIVAAYAGVESAAAEVLDCNDVKWRRPVSAMRQ